MKTPRQIFIHGKRWRQRSNGNTYHTVSIWIDGKHVFKSPITYGYDRQYEQTALAWLVDEEYLEIPNLSSSLWGLCEDQDIPFANEATNVARKRDL